MLPWGLFFPMQASLAPHRAFTYGLLHTESVFLSLSLSSVCVGYVCVHTVYVWARKGYQVSSITVLRQALILNLEISVLVGKAGSWTPGICWSLWPLQELQTFKWVLGIQTKVIFVYQGLWSAEPLVNPPQPPTSSGRIFSCSFSKALRWFLPAILKASEQCCVSLHLLSCPWVMSRNTQPLT